MKQKKRHVRRTAALLLTTVLAAQNVLPLQAAPFENGTALAAEDVVTVSENQNILKNGSFEMTKATNDTAMWPLGQQPENFGVWKATPGEGMQFMVEESSEAKDGGKVLHITSNNAAPRFDINQPIKGEGIAKGKNYLCTFWVKAENVTGTGFYVRLAQLKQSGTGMSVETARIKGTTDGWVQYAVQTNFPAEETVGVQIDIFAEKMTGDVWVDDIRIMEDYSVAISQKSAEMQPGDTLQLSAETDDGSGREIKWRSEDPEKASVDENGLVTAHKTGDVNIFAYTEDIGKHEAACTLSISTAEDLLDGMGDFEITESTESPTTVNGQAPTADLAKYWVNGEIPMGWNRIWDASKNSEGIVTLDVTDKESSKGSKSVHMNSTDSKARLEFLAASRAVTPESTYLCSFDVKTKDVKAAAGKGFFVRFSPIVEGAGTQQTVASPMITGTTDGWQTYSMTVPVPAKTTKIQVDCFAEYMEGDVWIDNIQIIKTYAVELDKTEASMYTGDTLQLNAKCTNGFNEPISWRSENPEIAEVDENGLVTAKKMGMAKIVAYTDEFHETVCEVSVEDSALREYYQNIRTNWKNRLTGNAMEDTSDEVYKAMMDDMTDTAQELWDKMNKGGNERASLWDDIKFTYQYQNTTSNVTEELGTGFSRIEQLATAYAAKGSGLYQNEELKADIIGALEWVYATMYNDTMSAQKDTYGNWWHWFIGMPQSLCNTVILMYEELDADLIEREARTLENFNWDPNERYVVCGGNIVANTAGNLIDTSLVSALRSAIGEESKPMNMAAEALGGSIGYVTSGNGYYEDGSYIDHGNLAYTGGYGSTLLGGMEKLIFIMDGTPWTVEAEKLNSVFDWIWNGIRPLYADGAMMDMTTGRGVARPSTNDQTVGKGLMKPISHLVDIAPEEQREAFRTFARTEIQAGVDYNKDYFIGMTVADMTAMRNLLKDDSIGEDNAVYHKNFGVMDKSVYHGENFDLGISMYSKRTGNFEYGNNENRKGWHQSDGALYLYTGDQSQYADVYWPTVDAHRLAGITTDHTEGYIPTGNSWNPHTSTKSWVGGSSVLNQYGSVGMDFEGETPDGGISSLKAKKSWFTFPNAVVALGAGINSSEDKATETIVDNRKIEDGAVNKLWADGKEVDLTLGTAKTESVNWALLEGNNGTQNIGYYFPEETEVSLLKETRTGNWRDINTAVAAGSANDKEIIRSYASVAIDHGTNPQGESYSYVLLPGRDAEGMASYAENPEVKILANTEAVQAVKNTRYNVTGYNFWEAADMEDLKVAAETPASVTMAKDGKNVTVGISDPTQSGQDTVVILKGKYVLAAETAGVTVECTDESAKITIAGSKDAGKTYEVSLTEEKEEESDKVKPNVKVYGTEGQSGYYREVSAIALHDAVGLKSVTINEMKMDLGEKYYYITQLGALKQGQNFITLEDKAGNKTFATFYYDTVAPEFEWKVDNSKLEVSKVVQLVTTEEIDITKLSIDGWELKSSENGKYVYERKFAENWKDKKFKVTDLAGNESEEKFVEVKRVDNAKPTGKFTQDITEWTKKDVTVTVKTSTDCATPDGWKKVDKRTFTKVITENGTYSVTLTSATGVLGEPQEFTVSNIDKEAPVIRYDAISAAGGYSKTIAVNAGEEYTNEQLVKMFTKATWVTDNSGTAKFSVDKWGLENGLDGYAPFTSKAEGTYKVRFYAKDEAGNQSTFDVFVKVVKN